MGGVLFNQRGDDIMVDNIETKTADSKDDDLVVDYIAIEDSNEIRNVYIEWCSSRGFGTLNIKIDKNNFLTKVGTEGLGEKFYHRVIDSSFEFIKNAKFRLTLMDKDPDPRWIKVHYHICDKPWSETNPDIYMNYNESSGKETDDAIKTILDEVVLCVEKANTYDRSIPKIIWE
jgi:hypothetical protein